MTTCWPVENLKHISAIVFGTGGVIISDDKREAVCCITLDDFALICQKWSEVLDAEKEK